MSQPTSALSGLRVVELGGGLATAHVGQVFADFGADVVTIEPPGGGPLRKSAAYPFLARGKRSVVADLATRDGVATAVGWSAAADVVVDANDIDVAGVAELAYEALAPLNPGLVRATITCFGDAGPYPWMAADEGVVMAKIGGFSAFAAMTDRAGPAFTAVPFCTFSASQTALHGILAALIDRQTTGAGQRVTTSLLHGIAAHDVWNWYLRIITQRYPDAYRPAPHVEDGVPNSALVFRLLVALTADAEWLQFSQTSRHLFVALMNELGLGWMFDDPDWADVPLLAEPARRVELWDRMLTAARRRTTPEWQRVFDAVRDVWAERFRSGPDVLAHPQLVHDATVVSIDDPERGPVRQPDAIARLSRTPARLLRSAPPLGEAGGRRAPAPPARSVGPAPTGHVATGSPLAGVTVVEFAMFYAAPFAASLLADLGARVIKVEPIGGDPLRSLASFPEVGAIKAMQGKESIELDMASPEGRRIVAQLIARADVVIQSFRAGAAERLGVDAESARAINPDLVYLNAPGYGTGGPCGGRPAYAPTIAAASGLAWRLVGPSMPGDPAGLDIEGIKAVAVRLIAATNTSFAQCDGVAALGATTAALLGLLVRSRGMGGQTISTSMLLTAAHANCEDVVDFATRPPTSAPDPDLLGCGPRCRLYRAADGWVFLSCRSDVEARRLAAATAPFADLASAIGDERGDGDEALERALEKMFLTRSAAEWERDLTAGGVSCVQVVEGPVEALLLGERSSDFDHLRVETEHPMLGAHPRLAPLVQFSRSCLDVTRAEALGASTDRILVELGYSVDEIAALRGAGRIGSNGDPV